MQPKVGDLFTYDCPGYPEWSNLIVLYRGASFSDLLWFDFVCCPVMGYEDSGFHTEQENWDMRVAKGEVTYLGHIEGVQPVRWSTTVHGRKAEFTEK